MRTERDCRQWFEEAARCYVVNHQGCAWCGRSYCVSHNSSGEQQTYYCQGCDFQVSFDPITAEYTHIVGEEPSVAAKMDHV